MERILITGGAGFIGSALVRHLVSCTDATIINVDKLTYAGSLGSLRSINDNSRYHFQQLDITNAPALGRLFEHYQPTSVVHLAAESHVDRSINNPGEFVHTNVVGTYTMLEIATRYWERADPDTRRAFRFLHVSTDEVFGSLGPTGTFNEGTPYQPRSPYSASKAAADHFVRAWHHTYGLPTLVTNCSNNYGPYQLPEKLIPLLILNASAGMPLPIYGRGENIRDWLYVNDHVQALVTVLRHGEVGQSYNIGGDSERTNLEVAEAICAALDQLLPQSLYRPHRSLIKFVPDRPGHDHRYAINATKISSDLGWAPTESFESGLRRTIEWYLHNGEWCDETRAAARFGERLGLLEGCAS